MESCEVAVVGAGPAGAAAAFELERAGVDYIIMDRAEFPRPKICAGIIPPAVTELLGALPEGAFNSRVRGYFLHSESGRQFRSRFPHPGYSVDRTAFDAWLVSRLERQPVRAGFLRFEEKRQMVVVRTDGPAVSCRFLIGADGAGSRVRCSAGLPSPRMAVAIQAEVALSPEEVVRRTDLWFHVFYVIAGGYGWVAPHRDRLRVGIGSVLPRAAGKAAFRRFLGHPRVEELASGGRMGDRQSRVIPMSGPLSKPGKGRLLLAGDAGGFVFPGTGEGIRYALLSGMVAARTAIEGLRTKATPSQVQRLYEKRLGEEGLLSLREVDFIELLRTPESAEGYVKRLTSLSRRASSS